MYFVELKGWLRPRLFYVCLTISVWEKSFQPSNSTVDWFECLNNLILLALDIARGVAVRQENAAIFNKTKV